MVMTFTSLELDDNDSNDNIDDSNNSLSYLLLTTTSDCNSRVVPN